MKGQLIDAFTDFIRDGQIAEAKALITAENVFDNLIWIVCRYLPKDDPELIQYFTTLGAPISLQDFTTSLNVTATMGKVKMLRKLLDLGFPVNTRNSHRRTALDYVVDQRRHPLSAMILIDAGGITFGGDFWPCELRWKKRFAKHRLLMRSSAISTMGAMRTKYGKDVSRIIGRGVWALRGIYER